MDVLNRVMDINTVKLNKNLINSVVRVVGKIEKVFNLPNGNYYQIFDHTGRIMVYSTLNLKVFENVEVVGRLSVGRNGQVYIVSNQITKKSSSNFPFAVPYHAQYTPIQMERNPFLNLLNDSKVRKTAIIVTAFVIILFVILFVFGKVFSGKNPEKDNSQLNVSEQNTAKKSNKFFVTKDYAINQVKKQIPNFPEKAGMLNAVQQTDGNWKVEVLVPGDYVFWYVVDLDSGELSNAYSNIDIYKGTIPVEDNMREIMKYRFPDQNYDISSNLTHWILKVYPQAPNEKETTLPPYDIGVSKETGVIS